HPSFAHSKTYHVSLDKPFTDAFIEQMAQGVCYNQVQTLPCQVRRLSAERFEIVLTQGLNRQIRRMAQALGYRVIDLERIALMTLDLRHLPAGELPQGQLRPLHAAEIHALKAALANSVTSIRGIIDADTQGHVKRSQLQRC
ncbi:MAG: hypothetical protein ACRDBI_15100, partial [Shewanella sp.]